ncbi:MAG: aspartate aminotransferase family protein [Caulobacteraceae bacterium]
MAMINAFAGETTDLSPSDRALIARREAALGPAYRLFYERPVHFVRGRGTWLFDQDGVAYLDAYNNVASVGHCHPRVVEALARQAAALNTHTRYLNEAVVAYAERLLAKFPRDLGHVMFTCTGSEANDLAIRIAKSFTGRRGIIVTELAYHGGTEAVARISPSLGSFVDLGADTRTVPAPDGFHVPGKELGAYFAAGVRAAIADLERHGAPPAALIVDTIFSSDGVFADPAGFLREAVDAIHQAGGLFIADEVQAGFARTGEAMWGFQRHGVAPDLVSLGKSMGAGHPIAALVTRPEVVEEFGRRSRYFNTFGGNPVSCAVGDAVIDVLESEGLQDSAREVGLLFRQELRRLAASHPIIADVRGAGLFIAVEIVSDDPAHPSSDLAGVIVNQLRERQVLISATGPRANVLKIRPPLVFSRDDAGVFMERLEAVLKALPT